MDQILEESRIAQSCHKPQWSVRGVDHETIREVWPRVSSLVDDALSHGQGDSTTSDHVLAEIEKGNRQMWVVLLDEEIEAILIMSVLDFPAGRKVFVDIISGRHFDQWADMVGDLLKRFKERVGAMCIEGSARPGLAKKLTRYGYRKKAIIMELK